jgi:predicted nucleotidyltransferase
MAASVPKERKSAKMVAKLAAYYRISRGRIIIRKPGIEDFINQEVNRMQMQLVHSMDENGKENEIIAITEVIKETVDCEKIYLFGSYAYGEPSKDSDLDFYVVIPDDAGRPIEVVHKINLNLVKINKQTPVDVLATHSSRFADLSVLPSMERKIVREGVLLYERNRFSQRMV